MLLIGLSDLMLKNFRHQLNQYFAKLSFKTFVMCGSLIFAAIIPPKQNESSANTASNKANSHHGKLEDIRKIVREVIQD